MIEIPLFPLNTVLFPGTPLQLHIFEPRYLQMVSDCIEGKKAFGVSLIRSGVEALGPLAEPFRIGCTAQIVQLRKLAGGRLHITVIGQERFRVITFERESHPYLVGKVQFYPIENSDPIITKRLTVALRKQVARLIRMLLDVGQPSIEPHQLPEDSVALAFLATAILQISPLQKQELLSMERADQMIDRLRRYYARELALLEAVVSKKDHLQAGGFSLS